MPNSSSPLNPEDGAQHAPICSLHSLSSMDHADEDSSSLSCLSDEENASKGESDEGSSSLSLSKCSSNASISDSNRNSDVDIPCSDSAASEQPSAPVYGSLFKDLATVPKGWSKYRDGDSPVGDRQTLPSTAKSKTAEQCADDSSFFNVKCVQVAVHPTVQSLKDGIALSVKSRSVPTLESFCSNNGAVPSTNSALAVRQSIEPAPAPEIKVRLSISPLCFQH